MNKKSKIWIFGILGGIAVTGAATFLISLYACRTHYAPGYYANADDLYMDGIHNIVSVKCMNTKKTNNVDINVDDSVVGAYITILGWKGTSYQIQYTAPVETITSFSITVGTLDGSFEQYTTSIYLHPTSDNASLNGINQNIQAVSMDLFGKKGNRGASGTAWVLKHVTSSDVDYKSDGNNLQYYLLTNWHVEDMYRSINANTYSLRREWSFVFICWFSHSLWRNYSRIR